MSTTDRNTLTGWFVKGAKPLASQFAAWINSFWHKDDLIPVSSIEGLQEEFDKKAETSTVQTITQNVTSVANRVTNLEEGGSSAYTSETLSAPANAGILTLKNATETVISTTLTNSNSFAIALPTAIADGKINESILIFKTGATLPTLTQPSGVVYRTEIPTIAINQTWTFCYERVTYDNGSTFETYVSATKNV